MRPTEREAKKLMGPDTSSWSGRRRMQKAFRQMALTPEEEIPPHRKKKRKPGRAKKHVHEFKAWVSRNKYYSISHCEICGKREYKWKAW